MSQDNPLDIIERILRAPGIGARPRFRPGSLRAESELLDDARTVAERVEAFAGAHALLAGWVQTTHNLRPYIKAEPLEYSLLNAELGADHKSLHVRQADRGNWVLTTIERADGPQDDEFIEIVEYLGRHGFGKLVYEVSWKKLPDASGELAFQPCLSRLAGGAR